MTNFTQQKKTMTYAGCCCTHQACMCSFDGKAWGTHGPLTVPEPVAATFVPRYLVNFAKAAPLCGCVELAWGLMHPGWATMSWNGNGHMQLLPNR